MNKSELISVLSCKTHKSKADVANILETALNLIVSEIAQGKSVSLFGFGSFHAVKRGARMGRNPRTLEPVLIEESTAVKFTTGSVFKSALKNED